MSSMVELVKTAAIQAVEAEKPVGLVFGTVVSASPLQIKLSDKLTLEKRNIVLTRNVTDYTVTLQFDHTTEAAGDHTHIVTTSTGSGSAAAAGSHNHGFSGVKSVQVLNGLKTGERVLLARIQGGRQYLVLDRMEG